MHQARADDAVKRLQEERLKAEEVADMDSPTHRLIIVLGDIALCSAHTMA